MRGRTFVRARRCEPSCGSTSAAAHLPTSETDMGLPPVLGLSLGVAPDRDMIQVPICSNGCGSSAWMTSKFFVCRLNIDPLDIVDST